jgi:spermidine synthase
MTAFVTGMSVMAIEMSASRLVAPFFGTSLLVWTNIIGIIMASLAFGYYMGGKLADKRPEVSLLYKIIGVAGIFILIIPFLATPVMSKAAEFSVSIFLGSLLGVLLLFVIPFMLLGMVTPFIVRLCARELDNIGNIAGSVYSLSTVGSILGTYLPALLFIPLLGTRQTILIFAAILILTASIGIFRIGRSGTSLVSLLIVLIAISVLPHEVRSFSTDGWNRCYEGESLYNYIQVHEAQVLKTDGSGTFSKRRYLVLNEGFATHSIYDPESRSFPFVACVWDYMGGALLPLVIESGKPTDVCIIGLAAGTVSKQMFYLYGEQTDLSIDGVEIDPEILKVGREYFDMNESGLNAITGDGRVFLSKQKKKYSLIVTDAYRQPYIPFHLTTREYFELVRDRLKDGGVMAINVGSTSEETDLFQSMISTIGAVFPNVDYLPASTDGAPFKNFVIVASMSSLKWEQVEYRGNMALFDPLLTKSSWPDMSRLLNKVKNVRKTFRTVNRALILTDDKAPVEFLIDGIIIQSIASGLASDVFTDQGSK